MSLKPGPFFSLLPSLRRWLIYLIFPTALAIQPLLIPFNLELLGYFIAIYRTSAVHQDRGCTQVHRQTSWDTALSGLQDERDWQAGRKVSQTVTSPLPLTVGEGGESGSGLSERDWDRGRSGVLQASPALAWKWFWLYKELYVFFIDP